jgi:hypothetical protein
MFKAMLFGFLVGVFFSRQVQDWSSEGIAAIQHEMRGVLHVEAYDKLGAALR